MAKEKDELIIQRPSHEPLAISHPIDAAKLVDYMSQVSLKEKEISQLAQENNKLAQEKNQLLQEKNQLEKIDKEKLEKINNLKDRLMGKEVLKSTQHSLWDLISIEVSKFWKELRRMEVKKSYIYSALDKHKLATEQISTFT